MRTATIFYSAFGLIILCYGVVGGVLVDMFDLSTFVMVLVYGVFGIILVGAGLQTRRHGMPGICTGLWAMSIVCGALTSASVLLGIVLIVFTVVISALAIVDPRLGEPALHRRNSRDHATT